MNEDIKNFDKPGFIEIIKKFKTLIASIVGLIVLIVISLFIYQEYQKNLNKDISDSFNKALILIQKNEMQKASKVLEEIIKSKDGFYSVSALNLIVEKKLIKDKNKVLKNFDFVILKSNIDKETKNLVIFKKILYLGDNIDEKILLENLNPIIKSNSVWKNTVSNYIQSYYLSKKEFIKAKEFGSLK